MRTLVVFFLAMTMAADAQTELRTIDDRVAEFSEVVRQRLEPQFAAAGLPYPPKRLAFVGIKQERVLEVYAAGEDETFRQICTYPVLGASGVLGPKLREGDRQVPEGVYRIWELNPNSRFHLSLWVGYPNEFELARAAEEERWAPGGEIMIHGGDRSTGCLAVGDPAAEDLFVLAALTGIENVSVVISPVDFRKDSLGEAPADAPSWTCEVYEQLAAELARYPRSLTSPADDPASAPVSADAADAAHTVESPAHTDRS
ncbi:MAG TPA: L,D-transpeptidase family protein [Chthoniobacterales bacterium]|nr:L,D-transpeptidase family protein [Chthoniobacterales bacterium]